MRRTLLALAAFCAAFSFVNAQDPAPQPAVDYLIVCADDLKGIAAQWAEWRSRNGRTPRVLALSELERENKDAPPTVTDLKLAVQKVAGDPPREGFQVLLLGDAPAGETLDPRREVPWALTTRLDCNPDPKHRERVPTDNFLGDLTADDDGKAEIAVGRVPARTAEDALTALEKVKAYEAAPAGPWLRKLTFFAGEGRFGPQVDSMLEGLFTSFVEGTLDPCYDVRMTYANINSSYAYTPSRFSAKVLEEANEGALMLVYMGHGSNDRLDNMTVQVDGKRLNYPILTSQDVAGFKIGQGRLPVMLIVACATGAMDDECLAEKICLAPQGPIAVVASSRDSHPYSNTLLQKALITEIAGNRRATLGEAFLRAKHELVLGADPDRAKLEMMATLIMPKKAERLELNRTHLSLYNLLGDPGLRLRYPDVTAQLGSGSKAGAAQPAPLQVQAGTELDLWARLTPALGVEFGDQAKVSGLDLQMEVKRTTLARPIKPVPKADLASRDAEKRTAAEAVVAENHASSNDKRVDWFKAELTGAHKEEGSSVVFWHTKVDLGVAPGEYVLKLFALSPGGERCGFAALRITVTPPKEAEGENK